MNLQQIRFVHQTVLQNFNLTQAAKALYTSQPGISKGIIELERELGCVLFERHGKRLTGLTDVGAAVYQSFTKILLELENVRHKSMEWQAKDEGRMVIATTHTQARYTLPNILIKFRKCYPKVQLLIHQGSPIQLAQYVLRGEADVAIATEGLSKIAGLSAMPLYEWENNVVISPEHPLIRFTYADAKKLTLSELAKYPLIMFDRAFAGRSKIDKAFANHRITPNIVLEAVDADVIKTYVKANLGVGIVPNVAFHQATDKPLIAVPCKHLFGSNTTMLAVKQNAFLRQYIYAFIELFSAKLTQQKVDEARNQPSINAN